MEEITKGESDAGLTRGQRIWQRTFALRATAKQSIHRARLVTASYQETSGLPPAIRKAKAFEKIVTEIPIYIEEDDLLAGRRTGGDPMDFDWNPELSGSWVIEEIDAGVYPMDVRKEDMDGIREICAYWKGKCLQDAFTSWLDKSLMKETEEIAETDKGAWVYYVLNSMSLERGHQAMNYDKVLKKGLIGVLAEVEAELQSTPIKDEASYQKTNFLKGLIIVLKAAIQYAKRHAALARELAGKAEGKRKAELEKLAGICDRIPENPARTFHEAVQTAWFLRLYENWEGSGPNTSPGRLDQYFYPYYKRDIEEGRLTREEAIELLECYRVKMSTFRSHERAVRRDLISEAQYLNVTLGGQTPDGKDATNEVSYLFLEAALRTRTPHPTLSIRYHDQLPEDFAIKALEVIKLGLGYPAFFNDKSHIPYLLSNGYSMETARNYCLGGCVHPQIPGESGPVHALFLCAAKCLELALHDGVDPRTGKTVGPRTGKFEDFKTFDQFVEAYKTQVGYFAQKGTYMIELIQHFRADYMPMMFNSALIDDCTKRGKSALDGGARYVSYIVTPVGVIDSADSLAAIKKSVFDEKRLSQRELMDALAANFEGKKNIQRLLLSAPKYGNDDEYVDTIAGDIYAWMGELIAKIDAPYGRKWTLGPYSVTTHSAFGKRIGARPNGQLAGLALADGSASPCQGADRNGPTALINSAGALKQTPLFCTLLNMKFHPSALKTREDLAKLYSLIRVYFDCGGKHVQFNVVDKKSLVAAQENPDLHRDLVVRVAGFSAYFTELARHLQDDIISRTEFQQV
jgi:pyruvate formate-lyase/glycerol dehydratase family glycyl radical enzyme